MAVVEMLVSDALYLNAEMVDEKHWIIHLSNGAEIPFEKEPELNGVLWNWKIGTQYFDKEEHARSYLRQLVAEKLTGKRVILHRKHKVPEICGSDGRACRCPGKCNTALCLDCPVAEQFFADRDGVELIYAVL